MTNVSVSASVANALAERDAAAKRAAAELVWRLIVADAGYGPPRSYDPLEVAAALAILGRDTAWFARTVRQLRLVKEGEAAGAPGGAMDRAKAAHAEALRDLDAHDAEIRRLEAAVAAAKDARFAGSARLHNALRAQDAAREQVNAAEQRRSVLANDETLAPLGGWAWVVAAAHAAEQRKAVTEKAEGGAS